MRGHASTVAVMPVALEFLLTIGIGIVTGILSGMFGIGGAVISTPNCSMRFS